jgi:hypothetical protein
MFKFYKWFVVFMLWMICVLNYADRQAVFSIFTILEKTYGFNKKELGLIGSAKFLEADRPLNVKYPEEKLKRLYGPNLQLENYVVGLTAKYPDCLGVMNANIFDFARQERTLYRGRYILRQLSKMKVKNPVPSDPYEWVQTVKNDPLLDCSTDGWSQPFILERKTDTLELRSKGLHDNQPEVVIGTIPWRESNNAFLQK